MKLKNAEDNDEENYENVVCHLAVLKKKQLLMLGILKDSSIQPDTSLRGNNIDKLDIRIKDRTLISNNDFRFLEVSFCLLGPKNNYISNISIQLTNTYEIVGICLGIFPLRSKTGSKVC